MVDHNISDPSFPFNTIIILTAVCYGPFGKVPQLYTVYLINLYTVHFINLYIVYFINLYTVYLINLYTVYLMNLYTVYFIFIVLSQIIPCLKLFQHQKIHYLRQRTIIYTQIIPSLFHSCQIIPAKASHKIYGLT